jgi:hypothetical protein
MLIVVAVKLVKLRELVVLVEIVRFVPPILLAIIKGIPSYTRRVVYQLLFGNLYCGLFPLTEIPCRRN